MQRHNKIGEPVIIFSGNCNWKSFKTQAVLCPRLRCIWNRPVWSSLSRHGTASPSSAGNMASPRTALCFTLACLLFTPSAPLRSLESAVQSTSASLARALELPSPKLYVKQPFLSDSFHTVQIFHQISKC